MSVLEAWQRPLFEATGATASVTFFVFSEQPLDLSKPLSRSRHGFPEYFSFDDLDLRHHARSDSQEWFDGFFYESMTHLALRDLGIDPRNEFELSIVYSVSVEVEDPDSLSYLMAAWAVVKWLCELGAAVVLDGLAIMWTSAGAIQELPADREFEIGREVQLVFETTPTGKFGHVFHSRGMAKFGRPDIMLLGAQPEDSAAGGALLNALAQRGALGAPLLEGLTVGPNGLELRTLEAYAPGDLHPEVNLNNDGLVLDIEGWGLRELGT